MSATLSFGFAILSVSFVERRGGLILRDVESLDDLLLPLRGGRQLLVVLEWMVELLGEILGLFARLLEVGFTFPQSIGHAVEGCSTEEMVPVGLSLKLALYSHFPWVETAERIAAIA